MTGQLLAVAPPALDQNASPYSGAVWRFYASGSSTPQAVYADADLSTSLGPNVTADADGRFPAIYFDATKSYRGILRNATGSDTILDIDPINPGGLADLSSEASGKGAGLIGYSPNATYTVGTQGYIERYSRPLTPADFASEVAGGLSASNHTAIFQALADAYHAGRSVHIPDLGFVYQIDPDTITFKPPPSYNNAYLTAPSITSDRSARIKLRSAGAFGIKIGTEESNYSGMLRGGFFQLPVIDADNKAFSAAPLVFPLFHDIEVDIEVRNAIGKAWQFGDQSAPTPAAGAKGRRRYERELPQWRRDVQSITYGANPTVTFATAHSLWPTSGRRCVAIDFFSADPDYDAIHARTFDCLVINSTQIQLLNVDTTGFAPFDPGVSTGACYLNFPSSRVCKKITGVTNANPCVITTAVPHLLTTGETVDIAEIGEMDALCGQYTATVLSSTTFSIPVNTTSTATWGAYNSGVAPGWVMPWVPLDECDIAEYHANATDIDGTGCFFKHTRVGVYSEPGFGGYDGKWDDCHFYNFPEHGELLTGFYIGGDNSIDRIQFDGPFRYCFWFFGTNNYTTGCSTNTGYIDPKDQYGVLGRTDTGASWYSSADLLKGRPSYNMLRDHSGLGAFVINGANRYNSVHSPAYSAGSGNRAAAALIVGATPSLQRQFLVSSIIRTPGGDGAGDYVLSFARPVPLDAIFMAAMVDSVVGTVREDNDWGPRSVFQRRIRTTNMSSVATDFDLVSVKWEYP